MAGGHHAKESQQIMIALVLGIVLGLLLYYTGNSHWAASLKPVGDLFIRFLKMMIVPLVLSSIFMAIINLGSPAELGALGGRAILYYTATTFMAVLIGLVVVNVLQPGVGLDIGTVGVSEITGKIGERVQQGSEAGLLKTIVGVFMDAVPTNPFAAMADGKILQVIVFAILLGIVALYHRETTKPLISLFDSLEKVSMVLVHWIMKLAPIGIFCLMLTVVAGTGIDALAALGKYMAAVLLGLGVHLIVLIMIGSWRHKSSPVFIVKNLLPPMLTAFSTSSSAATLPITMATVEDDLGVSRKTAQFVLPLGATVNMDGTALYESVAVIFIGQAYGLDLGIGTQVIIFLTASLAAVGAAAIPGAGLVTMSIVLTAVGFPLEGIGLILAVDRVLDMFRTAVNVFGDCVGTVVVESFQKKSA